MQLEFSHLLSDPVNWNLLGYCFVGRGYDPADQVATPERLVEWENVD